MKRYNKNSGFLLGLLFNLLLNAEWSIPAFLFLVLYFVFRNTLFLWLMGGAFLLWILLIFALTLLMYLANRSSTPTRKTQNKNPYSSKGYPYNSEDN